MSRRKKELPLYEQVEIADAGAEGMAVARVDGLVVFVPFVVPGDIVDIQLYKKKKNYAEGRAVKMHRPSPLRVDAACPHFGTCGGCKWQTMSYEAQLAAKQRQGRDALERLGGVRFFLHKNGVEAVEWSPEKDELFDRLPGAENGTIRPALVAEETVLKKGLAAVKTV